VKQHLVLKVGMEYESGAFLPTFLIVNLLGYAQIAIGDANSVKDGCDEQIQTGVAGLACY
jgi:hypothetical protein